MSVDISVEILPANVSGNAIAGRAPDTDEARLTVTVVICTRHRSSELRKCLLAIARQQLMPDEVIVVDNSDGDRATENASREFNARYLIEPNVGLSRARNLGLAESKSTIVAFLDDDSVPESQWLGSLLEPFVDPKVAAVTGEALPPDVQPANLEDDSEPAVWFVSNRDKRWFEIAAFGGLGIGANMALRKETCADGPLFDVRLGRGGAIGGGEESHAFLTLLSRGFSAAHTSMAIVRHPAKPICLDQEATTAIAYWLLLLREFRGHRLELLRFLFRRLRHKPLYWRRNSPDLGPLVTSNWQTRFRASLAGLRLHLRSRSSRTDSETD
jgi:glycosyltransferase involved in cell wall biosynthesis